MENMTKYQFILLVLLVSFMTALVTGIVAVTLMNQAPPPITQTIQRVIERSIGVAKTDLLPVDDTKQLELSATARDILIEDIINRVSPAVVSIVASKNVPVIEQCAGSFSTEDSLSPQLCQKGTQKKQVSAGSGFFVGKDGLILTNKHVVDDVSAEYTVITNSGKKLAAKVLARDHLNDMAVLRVEGTPPAGGYPSIALGDSDLVKIGQTAIAIGNALGEFQNTVSVGVISGLSRSLVASGASSGPEDLSMVMQTDAAINPGNSGGPLLNLRGEVVGLNTAIAEGAQNIAFTIPINQIKRQLASVKANGQIVYPFLGVRYVAVDNGALVTKGPGGEVAITPGSPAEKAGIIEKDIILEFAGKKVTKSEPLGKLIADSKVGEKVALKILRGDKTISVEVTLEERK